MEQAINSAKKSTTSKNRQNSHPSVQHEIEHLFAFNYYRVIIRISEISFRNSDTLDCIPNLFLNIPMYLTISQAAVIFGKNADWEIRKIRLANKRVSLVEKFLPHRPTRRLISKLYISRPNCRAGRRRKCIMVQEITHRKLPFIRLSVLSLSLFLNSPRNCAWKLSGARNL